MLKNPKGKKSERRLLHNTAAKPDCCISSHSHRTVFIFIFSPLLRGGLGGGEKRFLLRVERSAETASAFLISLWEYPIRGTEWCQRDSCPRQGSLALQPPLLRSRLPQDHWQPHLLLNPGEVLCAHAQTNWLRALRLLLEEQRFASYKLFWVAVLKACLLHLCTSTKARKVWRFKYQHHFTCSL